MNVRKKACNETIVQNLLKHRFLKREEIIEMRKKAIRDEDLEVGTEVVSLRDPVTMGRVKVPARGKFCTHIRCFDMNVYLESVKVPTQKVPCNICDVKISIYDIVIDGYFQDILDKTDQGCDSVTVLPSGEWQIPKLFSHDTPLSPLSTNKNVQNLDDSRRKRRKPMEVVDLSDNESVSQVIDLTCNNFPYPFEIIKAEQLNFPYPNGSTEANEQTDEQLLSALTDQECSSQMEAVEEYLLFEDLPDDLLEIAIQEQISSDIFP